MTATERAVYCLTIAVGTAMSTALPWWFVVPLVLGASVLANVAVVVVMDRPGLRR